MYGNRIKFEVTLVYDNNGNLVLRLYLCAWNEVTGLLCETQSKFIGITLSVEQMRLVLGADMNDRNDCKIRTQTKSAKLTEQLFQVNLI